MTTSSRITDLARDDLQFEVVDAGPIGGDPVVLLHGFPQRPSSWDRVAPLLHEAGLRTLALDQRGYAPAARPRSRAAYSLSEVVADLEVLVDELGSAVHLVGHDWGAAAGWVAASRPDLLRTFTAVSVPHPMAMVQAGLRGQLLRSWYMAFFQVPWLPERVLSSRVGELALRRSGMDEEMVDRYQEEMVRDGALPGALGWYRAIPLSGPGGLRRPAVVATTLVWSDGDVAITRAAAEGAARWVEAPYELVVLPGVSHWIPDHAPEALAEAVVRRVRGT